MHALLCSACRNLWMILKEWRLFCVYIPAALLNHRNAADVMA
jgi:hypothetical protein